MLGFGVAPSPRLNTNDIWANFCRYFSFSELGWLLGTFETSLENYGEEEEVLNREAAVNIVAMWMSKRWSSLSMKEPQEELLDQAFVDLPEYLDFGGVVCLLHRYESLHIEAEPYAGFPLPDVEAVREVYDMHARDDDGIRGKALFSVLECLNVSFTAAEDRQWFVQTVEKMDKDLSGSINLQELFQIMRSLEERKEEQSRKRELDLIMKSALPLHEVEDWMVLFEEHDVDGIGELSVTQLKALFNGIGVKWDAKGTDQILNWVSELDTNQNGLIDFGEFVNIMSRMWQTDFAGIRTAASQSLDQDTEVALRSINGHYMSADGAELRALSTKIGPKETFLMANNADRTICLKSSEGNFIMIRDYGEVDCSGTSQGMASRFSMQMMEDGHVAFQTGGPRPGFLCATHSGDVMSSSGSSGNAVDLDIAKFELVRLNLLRHRNWTKMMPKVTYQDLPQRRQSVMQEPPSPQSPASRMSIRSVDEVLERNRRRRATHT